MQTCKHINKFESGQRNYSLGDGSGDGSDDGSGDGSGDGSDDGSVS